MDVKPEEKAQRYNIMKELVKNNTNSAYAINKKMRSLGYAISWRKCKEALLKIKLEIINEEKQNIEKWNLNRKRGFPKGSKEALLAGKKAKETKQKKKELELYSNRPEKEKVRNAIKNTILKYGMPKYNINKRGKILYLSTHEFLLEKQLLNFDFYIAENKISEIQKMVSYNIKRPVNIKEIIYNKDEGIATYSNYNYIFGNIILDFCCIYKTAIETIFKLKDKIKNSRVFAFTICLRTIQKKQYENHINNIVNEITSLFKTLNLYYKHIYQDKKHMPMCTFIFIDKKNNYTKYINKQTICYQQYKRCGKCGETKDVCEFGKNQYYCKKCQANYQKQYHKKN